MSSLLNNRRSRGALAAFVSSAVAFGGAATLLGAETSNASSHREAPQIIADPQVDNTDVYAFVSPDKPNRVNLIGNWIPLEEPAGGPNFYPWADDARYNIKIDNDGDAKPDIIYRWKFSSSYRNTNTFLFNTGVVTSLNDPDLNFRQVYRLTVIRNGKSTLLAKNVPAVPSNVGETSMPNYASLSNSAITRFAKGSRTFAGQSDDAFFLDLRVFDLLYGAPTASEVGDDTLAGYNVNTIALQVPTGKLTAPSGGSGGDDPVIGVWSTTDRPSMKVQRADGSQDYSGKYVQVSRLGNPLVNEVVIPIGLKDAFNALAPVNDATVPAAVDAVLEPEVPKLIEALYGVPAPKEPRFDLFKVFFKGVKGLNRPDGTVRPAEMLRLNTSIPPTNNPNRLGVLAGDNAGFPNGRRLTDDVVDIELRVLEGALRGANLNPLLTLDSVNTNDKAFRNVFPYVALPHSGSDVDGGTFKTGASPSSFDSSNMMQAPTRRSPATSSAAASIEAPSSDEAPLAPIAVALGLGFGGLGLILLRRNRRETSSTS